VAAPFHVRTMTFLPIDPLFGLPRYSRSKPLGRLLCGYRFGLPEKLRHRWPDSFTPAPALGGLAAGCSSPATSAAMPVSPRKPARMIHAADHRHVPRIRLWSGAANTMEYREMGRSEPILERQTG